MKYALIVLMLVFGFSNVGLTTPSLGQQEVNKMMLENLVRVCNEEKDKLKGKGSEVIEEVLCSYEGIYVDQWHKHFSLVKIMSILETKQNLTKSLLSK